MSVVVPVYNPGSEFDDTMRSLLGQNFDSFEIVVVDDGSTSGKNIVDKYRSSPLCQVVSLDENRGGGEARNHGVDRARGKYVAFCDADDVWPPHKLRAQVEFMEANGCKLSHCDISIDSGGSDPLVVQTPETIDLESFLTTTSIYCSTACVERAAIGNAKFADRPVRHPFKFWVGLLEKGIVSHRVPSVAVSYKRRANSVSSRALRTLYYTLYAYLSDPSDKFFAIRCLFIRIYRAKSGYSRIKQEFSK